MREGGGRGWCFDAPMPRCLVVDEQHLHGAKPNQEGCGDSCPFMFFFPFLTPSVVRGFYPTAVFRDRLYLLETTSSPNQRSYLGYGKPLSPPTALSPLSSTKANNPTGILCFFQRRVVLLPKNERREPPLACVREVSLCHTYDMTLSRIERVESFSQPTSS